MAEPTPGERNAVAFLRMAAVELRQLAERSPDIAAALRHIAAQCEAEADEIERD